MKIIEESGDFLAIGLRDVDQSIVNLFTETLNNIDGVSYAGYRVEHPLTGEITVSLKVEPSKTTPWKAVQKALEQLEEIFKSLDKKLEALR
ncbi:MAG: RpoL/Rpb11 RNA polymerase subunit family protein [Candidatus Caldarchaeum sp.]|jgi:DNA-directed RNA polymerase subunit L